jgi:hypothetical protein
MIKVSLDKTVAVYIDSDNSNALAYAQQIIKVSAYIGILNNPPSCYAYGNWELANLSKWYDEINALEIQRIQVASGKNATDNRIIIDIGKTLGDPENRIDIYVIVSSDADFASLSQPILEAGKEFICIGTKGQIAKVLQNSTCYFLEDLEQHLSELESHYVIPINILRRFRAILRYTYAIKFGSYNEDWVSYTELEEKFPEVAKPYEYETIFKKYELAQLISYCSDDFEINQQRIRKIDHDPEQTRLSWLKNAYGEIKSSEADLNFRNPVSIGKLGKKLREIDRYYKNHFGSKKLTYWLRQYPEFKIDENNVLRLLPWM